MVNKKLETQKIKLRLGMMLNNGKCFVCDKSKSRSGFTIHHLEYIFNDVVYKNYTKDTEGQLKYYKDLEPLVLDNPRRFLYLCNIHHQALERLNRFKPETLVMLLKALIITKTKYTNLAELLKQFK